MSYVEIPNILLPKHNIDYSKWSVIACDQFTSQPHYWEELKSFVDNNKSTLDLILPEVYLNIVNNQDVINSINCKMVEYLADDTFNEYHNFIYLEREILPGVIRKGLVISVDLEAYDYAPTSKLPIRATERTVKERLPIRIEIRKDAAIEIPHICIFMDDRDDNIFKKLVSQKPAMEKLYDFDLNMNGGHIAGYKVDNSEEIKNDIESLLNVDLLKTKYGVDDEILFVVGDGNHSLATAKECWELVKKNLTPEEQKNHPARFALCELQNIHDDSIRFEPIHRFICGAKDDFMDFMQSSLKGEGNIKVIHNGVESYLSVNSDPTVAIADIQKAIDFYMSTNPEMDIDYIHGDDYLTQLAKEKDGIAIFMPKIEKLTLFDYVNHNGVMPRKSFSVGHAESKRYYLEAKRVR